MQVDTPFFFLDLQLGSPNLVGKFLKERGHLEIV